MLTEMVVYCSDPNLFNAQASVGKNLLESEEYQKLSDRDRELVIGFLRKYSAALQWKLIQSYGHHPSQYQLVPVAKDENTQPNRIPPAAPDRYVAKPKQEAVAMCKANIEKIWGKRHAN